MVRPGRRRRFCYDHPRPAVTVDIVLLRWRSSSPLEVLLIRRGRAPFAGTWALPGGFVDAMEDLEDAARRELAEETGLAANPLVQVGAYGAPGRDPRGHTVSVAFLGYVGNGEASPHAGDDAAAARFHDVAALPALAFDHREILRDALARLLPPSLPPGLPQSPAFTRAVREAVDVLAAEP